MEQEDDESATEWESLFQQDLETADELGLEVTQPVPGRRRLFNNSHEIPQKQELSPLKHLDSPKNIWDCSSLAPTSPILPGANGTVSYYYCSI